nr:MAG TPA: adenine-specific methyltransferase [Caudoviricetes sp.]
MIKAYDGSMNDACRIFDDLSGKIRFIFADPPYMITQARYDKNKFSYDKMWEIIQKMLAPDGVVAVTCSLTAAVEIMGAAPAGWYRYDLVWHKTTPTGFLNAKKAPLRNHELVLIFSPMPLGKHTYNPQKTYGHVRKVSKASSKAGCKKTELYGKAGLTTYDSTERYPLSVMTFKTDRQKSAIHPNQKPVELLRYLIRTYTNPGDTVMDPVAGSGTTGVAAYEEGRDCLLVEIDRQFFDEMINRFNNNNIKIDRI